MAFTPPTKKATSCDFQLTKEEVQSALGSYQYLKSYRVDGKAGRLMGLEYTIVMKEGAEYKFSIQTPEGKDNANGIVMKIYDRRTKKRVFTNFSASGLGTSLTYKSPKTGLYDVRFSFRGSKSYCGICVCGEKR